MVFHVHDNRECWNCGVLGVVAGSISIRQTEDELIARGWHWLEFRGRMLCPTCFCRRGFEE